MSKPRAYVPLTKDRVLKQCSRIIPKEKIEKAFGWDDVMSVIDWIHIDSNMIKVWDRVRALRSLGVIGYDEYIALNEIWITKENELFSKYVELGAGWDKAKKDASSVATRLVKKVVLRHLTRIQSITHYSELNG
jgi:hypothetical protein